MEMVETPYAGIYIGSYALEIAAWAALAPMPPAAVMPAAMSGMRAGKIPPRCLFRLFEKRFLPPRCLRLPR